MKIIIDNKSECDLILATSLVLRVLRNSKKDSVGCYHPMTFQINNGEEKENYIVWPSLNKKSKRFLILNDQHKNGE